jgi:hypothetical protein
LIFIIDTRRSLPLQQRPRLDDGGAGLAAPGADFSQATAAPSIT